MSMAARLLGVIRWAAKFGVLAICLALAFSFLAPVLPLADSVAHFRLHLMAALGVAGLLSGPLARRGGAAALTASATMLAIVGAIGLRPAWPTGARAEAAEAGGSALTMLQLNLYFRNADHAAVLALIKREAPDFIAFQEVSGGNLPLLDTLRERYPHQSVCPFAGVGAVAVLSRWPRAASLSTPGGVQGCAVGEGLTWLRVETPGGPLTVGSLHLHWPYPYGQHAQIGTMVGSLQSVPRPVLLGGDFNAAPWSHAVDRVARAADAPVLGGLRFTFHFSFKGVYFPFGMAIDHVLADAALQPTAISVSDPPLGSDHRAVVAKLIWREAGPAK